jgi:heptosyltransferase-3
VGLHEIGVVRRVLLVRVNFRIGNTLVATPLIAALRERVPEAELDVLCADSTACLFEGLPIDRIHTMSRRFLARPWQALELARELRRRSFDLAVEGGFNSFGGSLCCFLAGARHQIGFHGPKGRFFDVRLQGARRRHVYEVPMRFSGALGTGCADHPVYSVRPSEASAARRLLEWPDLKGGGTSPAFVALSPGGHRDKRWPAVCWTALAEGIARQGVLVFVFLGPDEVHLEPQFNQVLRPGARVLRPLPLRAFAALLGEARLAVSADSGPMHLATALGLPVVSILQTPKSLGYCPQGKGDRVLLRPTASEALEAVRSHPEWPGLLDRGAPLTGQWHAGAAP